MVPIDKQDIDQYIEDHCSDIGEVLQENYRETHLKTFYPQMLSGKVQAKFLEMICSMIRPKRVLEIGTFTAYAAIAMANGLAEDALLYTIEVNEEMEPMIRKYIELSGVSHKIKVCMGDATEIIPQLDEIFDLVFIDADKEQYCSYYELVLEKLRPNGFIIADNVLWGGKAVKDKNPDRETRGIRKFNTHVKNDPRVEQVMLSVRDGLLVIRKL